MKLIVGLGNPGKKFHKTRHNVGFMVLDAILIKIRQDYPEITNEEWNKSSKAKAKFFKFKLDDKRIELIKPQTFMNESGV